MTSPTPLRLLIADDADLVAEALQALLQTYDEFEVVARVNRGDLVLDAVREYRPDVALLDVDMPGATGIEAAAEVVAEFPDCRVLLLTALEGSGHLHRALSAGGSGYILKSTTADRLVEAIRTVAAGGTVVDPALAAVALRLGPSPLSDREAEILRLAGTGQDTATVAAQLFLSRGTVRNYLSRAIMKLDAANRAEAYAKAERHGWL
ncbi:MAG: response regulator transcription factor [Nakamurella sp.]